MEYIDIHEELEEVVSENAKYRNLLSQWYETWNGGYQPDGDLLDDTIKAIER